MRLKSLPALALSIAAALLAPPSVSFAQREGSSMPAPAGATEPKANMWTCSMHPQIRMPGPDRCPICQMELIPVSNGDGLKETDGDAVLKLSPRAAKLAEVRTAPVERKWVQEEKTFAATLAYDESRMARISARFPGRVEKLYVNYTGIAIEKGEHMAELFSPEAMVLQRELQLILDSARAGGSERGLMSSSSLDAVKSKMRLWGFTEEQIERMSKSGKVSELVTLYAPIGGIVVGKDIVEGQYFKEGDKLFSIAGLSKLWLLMDAYESDIEFLRYGQEVSFTAEAWPGETFKGRISFISPVLDVATRTVKVRVNVDNSRGRLKPGMFAMATARAEIDADGNVFDNSLAGKWISPMHPEIIKNGPGKCDICGMDLVPAESLGLVGKPGTKPPLVIPASAPLLTGKRAVVYVEKGEGEYEGREVVLGPKAGDYYIVARGLREGEKAVVEGNFKIDSALQIKAGRSMMSAGMEEGGAEPQPEAAPPPLAKAKLDGAFLKSVYGKYLDIGRALAEDSLEKAAKAASGLESLASGSLKGVADSAEKLSKAADISAARFEFSILSTQVCKLALSAGAGGLDLNRFHCPMAFDNKGAYWIGLGDTVENPYFGKAMPRCGELTGRLGAKTDE